MIRPHEVAKIVEKRNFQDDFEFFFVELENLALAEQRHEDKNEER